MTAKLDVMAAAVGTALGTTIGMGREALAGRSAPPRIVWCQDDKVKGSFEAPRRQTSTKKHTIASRVEQFEAHIWGASRESAEVLLDGMVVAMREGLHAVMGVTDSPIEGVELDLDGYEFDGDVASELGTKITARCSIRLPIEAETLDEARALTVTGRGYLTDPLGANPEQGV